MTPTVLAALWVAGSLAGSQPGGPEDPAVRDDHAIVAYHEQGSQAYEQLQAAIEAGSTHPRVRLYLALIERERGNLVAAAEILRAALEQPDDMERGLRLELAATLSWDGTLVEAQEQYAILMRSDPDDRVAAIGHARMLAWQGRLKEAREQLLPLVEAEPTEPEARLTLAMVDTADNRRRAAAASYRAVLEHDPDNEQARRGLESLDASSRVRLGVLGGYAYTPSSLHAGQVELEASVDLRAAWMITGGYASTLMRWTDPVVTQANARLHTAHAGVVANLQHRFFFGLDYRVLLAGIRHHHAVAADVAVHPVEAITVGVTVRPGLWSDGVVDLMGRVGLDASIRQRVTLGVQWFGYRDPGHDQRSHAVVARLGATIVPRWSVQGWGGWLRPNGTTGWVVGGETSVTVHPRVDLLARYEYLTGLFDRHSVGAGIKTRF